MSMSGSESEQELFKKPLFITFCMFVGMSLALVMHVFVVFFSIPFPGYDHHLLSATPIDSECSGGDYHSLPTDQQIINSTYHPPRSNLVRPPQRIPMQSNNDSGDSLLPTNTDSRTSPTDSDANNTFGKIHHRDSDDTSDASIILIDESDRVSIDNAANANESKTKLPLSTYFIIAIPAFLDVGSTALLLAGLVYLDPSIFQMISNSQVVFVALMKHYVLKNLLCKFHWIGVFWIVVSILIGGSSALRVSRMSGNITEDGSIMTTDTLIGVALVIAGTVICSLMFVIMEKLMNLDVPVPPLLLIGMIGFWGVVLSIFVMFPVG